MIAVAQQTREVPPRDGPRPIPPGSRLWDDTGDTLFVALSAAAFMLQVMHPKVSAGVDQHSVFRNDPLGRAVRSFDSVLLWVYGGQAALDEGLRLRRLHAAIRGFDEHGERYSALDPEAYAWVHATAFVTAVKINPLVRGRALTRREEDELYAETLQLGEILRVPSHLMPQSTGEYWDMYHTTVREQLRRTKVAAELLAMVQMPSPPLPLPQLWRALSWPARRAAGHVLEFVTVGGLTSDARAVLGVGWTPAQNAQLRGFMTLARPIHSACRSRCATCRWPPTPPPRARARRDAPPRRPHRQLSEL